MKCIALAGLFSLFAPLFSADLAVFNRVRVVHSKTGLNIRKKPRMGSKILARVPDRDLVVIDKVLPRVQKIKGRRGRWNRISWDGRSGYSFDAYFSVPPIWISSVKGFWHETVDDEYSNARFFRSIVPGQQFFAIGCPGGTTTFKIYRLQERRNGLVIYSRNMFPRGKKEIKTYSFYMEFINNRTLQLSNNTFIRGKDDNCMRSKVFVPSFKD